MLGSLLANLAGIDGRHVIVADAAGEHRLWLRDPMLGRPLAAVIPLDKDFITRIASLLRFHRCLLGRAPGPLPRGWPLTAYRLARLDLMLRALDLRSAGATYRQIAVELGREEAARLWQDEAGTLWESNTICRYLATAHAREDLLPPEPFQRALIERWMDWAAGDLNLAWRYSFMALVRNDPGYATQSEIDRSIANWGRLMSVLNGQLAETRAYVAGAALSLADIAVGLAAHRWRCMPVGQPSLPEIDAYLDRLRERPAFAQLATAALP